MATKTIGQLDQVSTPAVTDKIPVEQGGVSRYETITQLQTLLPTSSATAAGLVELATDAEAITGTDDGRALTAANLKAVLQGLSYAVNMAKGTNITAAANLNVNNVAGNYVGVNANGATAITSLGTGITGAQRSLLFLGAVPLIHNSTYHILKGGTSITTANGDVADVVCEGGANWRYVDYSKYGDNAKFFTINRSGAQSINENTATQILFDSEDADAYDVFNTATYRAIIPNGETWRLEATVTLANTGTSLFMYTDIYKNSSLWRRMPSQTVGLASPGDGNASPASGIATGNGTDYYEVFVFQNSGGGGAKNTAAGVALTRFEGHKI